MEGPSKNIEIIELKSEIQKLKRGEADQEEIEEAITPNPPRKAPKTTRPADYQNSCNVRLEWVDPSSRKLAERLIERLTNEVPTLIHQARYRWYSFYRGQPLTERNQVAVIFMGKKHVRLAIRTNPAKFSDPFKLSNPVSK